MPKDYHAAFSTALTAWRRTWSQVLLIALLGFAPGCATTSQIDDGQTAFRLGKYKLAVELLADEYGKTANPVTRARLAEMTGDSYDALNRPEPAADWYGKAITEGAAGRIYAKQAAQFKKLERYEEAIVAYQAWLRDEPDMRPEIRREIEACREAMDVMAKKQYVEIENLSRLNSPAEDFAPVFYQNGALVFTSGRSSATGEGLSEWSGTKYFDLFISERQGRDFDAPEPFDPFLNQPYHDGTVTFSAAFDEMYFTRCGTDDKQLDDACALYYSYREPEGNWSQPAPVEFFGDSVNIGHPAISDGERLYFSASGDPLSYGGADLYYVRQTEDGWGSPISLGPQVNTEGNEVFPWVAQDGRVLFASDGLPGMGGLDVWQIEPKGDRWSDPERFAYPINSGADDFGLILIDPRSITGEDTLMMGFFSSSREGGRGMDDLYRFISLKPPPPPPVYLLEGLVERKILADSLDPQSEVVGYAPMTGARLSLYNSSLSREDSSFTLGMDGRFTARLDSVTDYKVTAAFPPDYFAASENVSTIGRGGAPGSTVTIELRMVLERIFEEAEIRLNNIYYDFNSAALRPESFPELNKLAGLLNDNPTLVIELASHTDSRGTKTYNQRLSQARAESVVTYLVDKGIPASRLIARGYGEERPVNQCVDGVECSEEEHQQNRRTTFSVQSDRLQLESEEPDSIRVDPKPED